MAKFFLENRPIFLKLRTFPRKNECFPLLTGPAGNFKKIGLYQRTNQKPNYHQSFPRIATPILMTDLSNICLIVVYACFR